MPRPLVRDLSRFLAQPPPGGRPKPRGPGANFPAPSRSWYQPVISSDWRQTVRDADVRVTSQAGGKLKFGGGIEFSRTLVERALNQWVRNQPGLSSSQVNLSPDGRTVTLSGPYRLLGGGVRIPFSLTGRPEVQGSSLRLTIEQFRHPGPGFVGKTILQHTAREARKQGHPVVWDNATKSFEISLQELLPGVTLEGNPEVQSDGGDRLVLRTPGSNPSVQGDGRAQVRIGAATVSELLAKHLGRHMTLERLVPGTGAWRLEGTLMPGLGELVGNLLPGVRGARVPLGMTLRTKGSQVLIVPDLPVKALWQALSDSLRLQGLPTKIVKEGIAVPLASLAPPRLPLSRLDLARDEVVAEVPLAGLA